MPGKIAGKGVENWEGFGFGLGGKVGGKHAMENAHVSQALAPPWGVLQQQQRQPRSIPSHHAFPLSHGSAWTLSPSRHFPAPPPSMWCAPFFGKFGAVAAMAAAAAKAERQRLSQNLISRGGAREGFGAKGNDQSNLLKRKISSEKKTLGSWLTD